MDRQKYAYDFFIKKGYSPQVSAGIVGNLIHESGLKTGIEGDKGLKGGSSFGLAQWREGRLESLKQRYGNSWTDFDKQLDFVHHELNTTEKSTLNRLQYANTPEEASDIFMRGYERPSKQAIAQSGKIRAKNARNLFGGNFDESYTGGTSFTNTSIPTEREIPNFLPKTGIQMEGDSSHLMNIELPLSTKVLEAKKDILANEIINQSLQNAPSPEIQSPVIEQPQSPTYEYLTQTNLFQLD